MGPGGRQSWRRSALRLTGFAGVLAAGFATSFLLIAPPAPAGQVRPQIPTGPPEPTIPTFTRPTPTFTIGTFPTPTITTVPTPTFTRPIATIGTTPPVVTLAPAACIDGTDNDGDGLTDLADPGCSSPSDNNESDDPPPVTTTAEPTTAAVTQPPLSVPTPTVLTVTVPATIEPKLPVAGSDIERPLTKTPAKPPPKLPRPAPPPYGVVDRTAMQKIRDGLRAIFVFAERPMPRSRLKAVWYYNNKPVGDKQKPRAVKVASFARAKGGLPKGFWRCSLRVRIPGGSWKTVQEARTLLR